MLQSEIRPVEPALFSSLESAMLWAFRRKLDTRRRPRLNHMIRSAANADSRPAHVDPYLAALPGGWDGVAQSGLLQSFVAALPELDRSHLVARFGTGGEQGAAIHRLGEIAHLRFKRVALPVPFVVDLVARHYLRRTKIETLADKHALPLSVAFRASGRVSNFLKDVASRAEDEAWFELRKRSVLS